MEGLFEEWLIEERESLYLQQIRLLQRTREQLLLQERFEQVLPLAERLVQQEPYDEAALRTLMRAYQSMGRRGAALAAYERFAALAADELGVEPDPSTQSLVKSIRETSIAPLFQVPAAIPVEGSPEEVLRRGHAAMERGDGSAQPGCLLRCFGPIRTVAAGAGTGSRDLSGDGRSRSHGYE